MSELSPLQRVKKKYASVLKMSSDDALIVDCFMAAVTAVFNRRLNESVWMYFIGPPGSGKTETVSSLRGYPRAVMLTTPTENAFMSGTNDEKGDDPSLLPLLDGKILVWKDFTAMMELKRGTVDKILAELRDVYDQYCSKASGKIGFREYSARFGMIACVTGAIDSFMEHHQQLGQRFLSFRINRISQSHAQRIADLKNIRRGMNDKEKWKEELRLCVQGALAETAVECTKGGVPSVPADIEERIIIMSDVLALARTVPQNDKGNTVNRPEIASRIMQQLINLGSGHAIVDGRNVLDESDMQLICRVVLDSLPLVRRRLLGYMFRCGPNCPANPPNILAEKAGTDPREIVPLLRQLAYSGILKADNAVKEGEVWYKLSEDIYKSNQRVEVF